MLQQFQTSAMAAHDFVHNMVFELKCFHIVFLYGVHGTGHSVPYYINIKSVDNCIIDCARGTEQGTCATGFKNLQRHIYIFKLTTLLIAKTTNSQNRKNILVGGFRRLIWLITYCCPIEPPPNLKKKNQCQSMAVQLI